jgi:lipoprotein NlpD
MSAPGRPEARSSPEARSAAGSPSTQPPVLPIGASALFPLKSPLLFPLVLVAVALVAAGCASRPVPVEDRLISRSALPGAGAPLRAPATAVAELPPAATYTVKRGDTLHQIALDTGLDYRDLAAWNNIGNANRIFPGQVLRLAAPGAAAPIAQQDGGGAIASGTAAASAASERVTTAPLRTPDAIVESRPVGTPGPVVSATPAPASSATGNLKTSPKAIKEPYSEQAVRDLDLAASAAPAPREALAGGVRSEAQGEPRAAVAPLAPSAPAAPATSPPTSPPGAASNATDSDQLAWAWPAKGKIVAGFSETANLKGIDIAGTAGEPVRASAPGRVVYAGNGLRGYGKLIIIKHNGTYLSAYAHNREILVKEGQQVTRGQKIAEMGNTDADQVKLHFEIRRHGKPIDPTKFLPPA